MRRSTYHCLYPHVEGRGILWVQSPIRLDTHSKPHHDLAILDLPDHLYALTHPNPPAFLLVAEVADTLLKFDRQVEVAVCLRASIPEVWLVDLVNDRVEVFTHPSQGKYRGRARWRQLSSSTTSLAVVSVTTENAHIP